MTIRITAQRLALGRRAPLSSAEYNEFFSNLMADLVAMATEVNANSSADINSSKEVKDELAAIRNLVLKLSHTVDGLALLDTRSGLSVKHTLSAYDTRDIVFSDSSPANLRASVSPIYGQITVPINGEVDKFVKLDFRTDEVVSPSDLEVSVVGTFDKGLGDGSVDYEYSGTIVEGEPNNAFNGMNTSRWVREVSFDTDSDVDEVECQLTVSVPAQFSNYANCIIIHPFPNMSVDVTSLSVAAVSGGAFTTVSGFTEIKGASPTRIFFPTQQVAQIRIRLRQKNWGFINAKKVFRYGLEELSLVLVDWDKTWDAGAAITDNHLIGFLVTAPDGYEFNELEDLISTPDYELELPSTRHLHIKVASDIDGASVLWDSDVDANPSSTPVALGGITSFYVLVTLNFVSSSGGVSSPFPVGTSPYLNKIDLLYTLEEV